MRALSALWVLVALWTPPAHAQEADLPSPLSLSDVARLAHAARPEVAAATSLADAADRRPSIVNVPDDPMLMVGLDHLPLPDPMGLDGSILVQQTFPFSDVLGARARTAEAEARRLRRDVERVGLDVELEAVTAFLELYMSRVSREVLDRQMALADQLIAAAQARYASASGASTDVLRAESERARLAATRRALDGRIAGMEGMLAAALGHHAPDIPPLTEPADDPALDPGDPRALIERALGARPELAAAHEAIARARSEIDVMEQMYFPMGLLRVGGSYTMSDGPGLMAMIGISIPIFRDRLDSGVGEARAMESMTRSELEAMTLMVQGQVASARGELEATRGQRDALENEVLPLARQTIDAALAQYGAAEVPQVTVIEALRSLFSIELEVIDARVAAALAQARLRRAVGLEAVR